MVPAFLHESQTLLRVADSWASSCWGIRMYLWNALLAHLTRVSMVESLTPFAAAVVAAPIRNEWPEYLDGLIPVAANADQRRSIGFCCVSGRTSSVQKVDRCRCLCRPSKSALLTLGIGRCWSSPRTAWLPGESDPSLTLWPWSGCRMAVLSCLLQCPLVLYASLDQSCFLLAPSDWKINHSVQEHTVYPDHFACVWKLSY